jgi:transposase
MPWKVKAVSDIRLALCHCVRSGSMRVSAAAQRFGVSRKTAHKWLALFDQNPDAAAAALVDRSRRPVHSPERTSIDIEQKALQLRDRYNWGARKIHFVLRRETPGIPSIRTLSSILARNGRIASPVPTPPLQRFERGEPNELWQLDFKGPVEVDRKKIMPFTILDDHSRYLLAFKPCTNMTMATAWNVLWDVFGQVGLPLQILCDNAFNARKDSEIHFEQDCNTYRHLYNNIRPHQAIGDVPPVLRWLPSPRPRPSVLPDVQYPAGSILRRVNDHGRIRFKNFRILCGQGIDGDLVRIEERDNEIAVYYCAKQIRCISHDQLKADAIL